jgi:hypothetical protein
MSTNPQEGSRPTVVLVHGGFVDGSGWQGVYNLLKDTYNVRVVQNPTLSLQGDGGGRGQPCDQCVTAGSRGCTH